LFLLTITLLGIASNVKALCEGHACIHHQGDNKAYAREAAKLCSCCR